MSLKIINHDLDIAETDNTEVILLPKNFLDSEKHVYRSTCHSFLKFAQHEFGISYLTEPEFFIEEKSGEWFCPAILITSAQIIQNPHLISIVCGVIANYATDYFKGKSHGNIDVVMVHKKTKTTEVTELRYKGDISGLNELKDHFSEIAKK